MKITVSYLSKINDLTSTLAKIEQTSAEAIHLDLMDLSYVNEQSFIEDTFPDYFQNIQKPLDAHLMVNNPEKYLDMLLKIKTEMIFFHPSTSMSPLEFIKKIKSHNILAGIVINPSEDTKDFLKYLEFVDAVLIMSVNPGKGGQKFLRESLVNYELIKEEKKNYNFLLYVDGGINDETITYVKEADGVIVGSYVCDALNYEMQIQSLKNNI